MTRGGLVQGDKNIQLLIVKKLGIRRCGLADSNKNNLSLARILFRTTVKTVTRLRQTQQRSCDKYRCGTPINTVTLTP